LGGWEIAGGTKLQHHGLADALTVTGMTKPGLEEIGGRLYHAVGS